ncbi:MAG: carbohydrate kinase [Flavobacteriales bacterium]|nr:carbohydrate kinase [Flavobacteriales bacterium]|tara:strand:+ start:166 stop:1164 length:999 start_codon:yes stop_codon:yes gene_type:complete
MKKTKVVCIGEALIDRINNKSREGFKDFLGGAPANVVCALSKLKIDSAFIGCLGNDQYGQKFVEKFKKLNIDINFLQLNDNASTRIIKVDRDNSGNRYFSGFETNLQTVFADETISKKLIEKDFESLEKLFRETKYLVAGTILLSSEISAESIYYVLRVAKNFDVKIVIDINWREVFWDYSAFSKDTTNRERVELIKNFVQNVDILKLAKEEATIFFDSENPFEISQQILNRPDVIITDGSNPIHWYINGIEGINEVFNSSKIEDTTGAGDAFLAGLISQLVVYDHPLNELEIRNIIEFASICGYITCLGEGAIEQQPDYVKVNEFLGRQIS